jgi:S1-C subfamily serine protease
MLTCMPWSSGDVVVLDVDPAGKVANVRDDATFDVDEAVATMGEPFGEVDVTKGVFGTSPLGTTGARRSR